MSLDLALACLALAVWGYLLLLRGGFWLGRERDDRDIPKAPAGSWPSVAAIIPARNEADMLPASLASLLAQDYPGQFFIVVVDDESEDGTADTARRAAAGSSRAVKILSGKPRPPGWTGKVWAMQQGVEHIDGLPQPPEYILFTDADIGYAPDALSCLVARSRADSLVLASLMAKLNCTGLAERALIPAFIFFFQMLYPFRWVATRSNPTAAAAGGCMLIERRALARAGGVGAIRGALIDDCALATVMKREGPIWLGLTERAKSLRRYPHISDIRGMVARSAYAQLRYSPLLLAGTVVAMGLTYVAPPVIALFGTPPAQGLAAASWGLMALAFQPTLRLYGLSPLWGAALPLIAVLYLVFTLDSAYQHGRGRGGMWKGRAQALPGER